MVVVGTNPVFMVEPPMSGSYLARSRSNPKKWSLSAPDAVEIFKTKKTLSSSRRLKTEPDDDVDILVDAHTLWRMTWTERSWKGENVVDIWVILKTYGVTLQKV